MGPRVRGDDELKNFERFPSRILPDGQISKFLSSPLCKNISVFPKYKPGYMICRPVPLEGRFAIVTDAGRDAVDAGGATDESADLRTEKACGPDAPTLASSS
jgi:hypothetical protein